MHQAFALQASGFALQAGISRIFVRVETEEKGGMGWDGDRAEAEPERGARGRGTGGRGGARRRL